MSTHKLILVSLLAVTCAAASESPVAAPQPVDASEITRGSTKFAVDLYHRLAASPGNVFFSPLSLSSALAMTYAGARGDTAAEMASVLHFPPKGEALHAALGALKRDFNSKSPDYELAVANALWGQRDFIFQKPFLDTLDTYYGAALNPVDFQTNAEAARLTINRWVEERTRNRIMDLIGPGVLDSATRLVLTNAVYFKGLWVVPFKKDETRPEPFHVTNTRTVTVPLMNLTHDFAYVEDSEVQVLEMPYKGEVLSMAILLPRAVDGLPSLERTLTAERLESWLTGFSGREITVTVPRFKMTSEFQLEKVLAEMGMPLAFTNAANFSGMTGQPGLYITAVIHKGFVDANEEGTEAAAATAVAAAEKAAVRTPPVAFRADHPFLFLIRDQRSGCILFMGRVTNPAE